jgi:hypothetical protein
MDSRTKLYLVFGFFAAFLLFGLGWCSKPDCKVDTTTTTTTSTKRDTVKIPQLVYRDTGSVRIKYRIIDKSRIDTVKNEILANIDSATTFPINIDSSGLFLTPAFSFGYHTISTIKDTFEIKYHFPENRFEFAQFPAPREKVIETVKETITIYIEKPKAWYQEEWFEWTVRGALFIGGVYAGSQIGGSK